MSTRFVVLMSPAKRRRAQVSAAVKPMCRKISKKQSICVIIPKKRRARRAR